MPNHFKTKKMVETYWL